MRALLRFLRFVVQIQGFIVTSGGVSDDKATVVIRGKRHGNAKPRCPECGDILQGVIKMMTRRWRHLDLCGQACFIEAEIRQGFCKAHGKRVERVPWAAPGCRHTHAFDHQVASFVRVADKSAASETFSVTWRTVGRIVTRVVSALMPRHPLADLTRITIDETSHKRGHRYITVVSCLDTGRVVWVGKGKSSATLHVFFDELGEKRTGLLEVIATDLGAAFTKVVKERAPQADLVYDRFHVVQLLTKAIDEIRREECRQLEGEAKKAIKSSRFALLRNPKHRTPKDIETIERISNANETLFDAYQLRVDFEELWECDDTIEARAFLGRWGRDVLKSPHKPLHKFIHTVRRHLDGILGFFRQDGVTSAVAEGLNNKIKLIIHRAFGFADIGALMAMIHLCCGRIELPTQRRANIWA